MRRQNGILVLEQRDELEGFQGIFIKPINSEKNQITCLVEEILPDRRIEIGEIDFKVEKGLFTKNEELVKSLKTKAIELITTQGFDAILEMGIPEISLATELSYLFV